jgi:lysosomal alpha-mannosidase
VDYQDFAFRGKTKNREMLWQGSENFGEEARIFTGILPNVYWPPSGFCWERPICRDQEIKDEAGSNNVKEKVDKFLNLVQAQSQEYKTNHIIMTFGNDFFYSNNENSRRWFQNIDKLIHYVNQLQINGTSKVNVLYSTPACYLYALHQENAKWQVKRDDFFPYADSPRRFWTGYFTSRPALKYNVRRSGNYLQAVRQLATWANLNDNSTIDSIRTLERAMGVVQHHDAITGTEKQYVSDDYTKQLSIGVNQCVNVINDSLNAILIKNNFNINNKSPIFYCSLLNISECLPIENTEKFNIIIYNPLPRRIKSWISIPVVNSNYEVSDLTLNKLITIDIVPVYNETSLITERKSQSKFKLVFEANLPQLGFKVIFQIFQIILCNF